VFSSSTLVTVALLSLYRCKGEGRKGNTSKSYSPAQPGGLLAHRHLPGCIEGRLSCVGVRSRHVAKSCYSFRAPSAFSEFFGADSTRLSMG
jgi:hypothetical protein